MGRSRFGVLAVVGCALSFSLLGGATPPIQSTPSDERLEPGWLVSHFSVRLDALITSSRSGFLDARIDSSMRENPAGDRTYRVKRGHGLCGPEASGSRIVHWLSGEGRWDYACHAEFHAKAQALIYFDEVAGLLAARKDLSLEQDSTLEEGSQRRRLFQKKRPALDLIVELEATDDNSFEVALRLKPTGPAPVTAAPEPPEEPRAQAPPPGPHSGGSPLSRTLKKDLAKLLKSSQKNFKELRRPETKTEDPDGDRNYLVRADFNACGPSSTYNKVWHWRSMKGNWEYVCDVNFEEPEAANAYYEAMGAALRALPGYRWEPERRVDDTTQRRLVGWRDKPPLKLMLDFDVSDDDIEIEFWFKQKNDSAPPADQAKAQEAARQSGAQAAGNKVAAQVKRLAGYSKQDFAPIRDQSSERQQENGQVSYATRGGFTACGKRTDQSRVWHWQKPQGGYEYRCDVALDSNDEARGYFDAMSEQLRSIKGFTWSAGPSSGDGRSTRLTGRSAQPSIWIELNFDRASERVAFRFRQARQHDKSITEAGNSAVNKNLTRDMDTLLKLSRADFAPLIDLQDADEDGDGDRQYVVKTRFNACGPGAVYNKVWHWRSMRGNWEYVCDMDFQSEEAGHAYFDGMSARLRSLKDFRWDAEINVDGTTRRRLVGWRDEPPLKVQFDMDFESDTHFEVELWFKKKNNPGGASGKAEVDPDDDDDGISEGSAAPAVARDAFTGVVEGLATAANERFAQLERGPEATVGDAKWYPVLSRSPCGETASLTQLWEHPGGKRFELVCRVPLGATSTADDHWKDAVTLARKAAAWTLEKEMFAGASSPRRVVGTSQNGARIALTYWLTAANRVELELRVMTSHATAESR